VSSAGIYYNQGAQPTFQYMFGSFLQPQSKRLVVKMRKMVKVHKIVPNDDLQNSDWLHERKSAICSYRKPDYSSPRHFITFL
jgi:hypothetical protein